jgi:hypothetical protein
MEPTILSSGACHFPIAGAHSNCLRMNDRNSRKTHRLLSGGRVFDQKGVRLKRRRNGVPQFNFSQVLWLYPGVGMDWTARLSRQAETLAANILIRFLPRRGRYRALSRTCLCNQSVRSEGLAWQFARQVLVSLPQEGSELEPDFVREWLQVHLEIVRRRRVGGRKSAGGVGRDLPRGPWMSPGQVLD